jgi:hypothetical protein
MRSLVNFELSTAATGGSRFRLLPVALPWQTLLPKPCATGKPGWCAESRQAISQIAAFRARHFTARAEPPALRNTHAFLVREFVALAFEIAHAVPLLRAPPKILFVCFLCCHEQIRRFDGAIVEGLRTAQTFLLLARRPSPEVEVSRE